MSTLLEVKSPYDGSVVGTVALDGEDAVDRKLEAARTAFSTWRELDVAERCRIVAQGLERFMAAGEEVARDISLQMGKPITQALREVETMRDRALWALEHAAESLAPEPVLVENGLHRRIDERLLEVGLEELLELGRQPA